MFLNIHWNGVWQSITSFWLPTFGFIIAICVIILIVHIIQKKKRNRS